MEAADLTYRVVRVGQPGSARALTDGKATQFLFPFMLAEQSTSSVAGLLGVRINVAAYWVRRLLGMGLIRPTRLQRRGGRAVQHYRAAADAFFVPFSGLSASTLEEVFQRLTEGFQAAYTRSLVGLLGEPGADWGVCISAPDGRPTLVIADEQGNRPFNVRQPSAPAGVNLWHRLHLDFEDAKAFQSDLLELLIRYDRKKGGQEYIVHLGSLPLKR